MRVCLLKYRVTCSEADQLETYLLTVPEIRSAVVNERTGDAVITHSGDREAVLPEGEWQALLYNETIDPEGTQTLSGTVNIAGRTVLLVRAR